MKRYFAFAAALTACAAASAQSSVTMYGVVDQYFDRTDTGAVTVNRLQSGGLAGSRLGFRGREDLGGGYGAFFLLEMGINADDGSLGQGGLGFGRQSFVGLATPYGDLSLGRQYVPHFYSLVTYALNGGLAFGQSVNYYTDPSILRVNNSVAYSTKSWNGFTGQFLYGMGENAASKSIGNVAAASLAYASGPLKAGVAFTQRKTTATNSDRYLVVGGTYDFGAVKAGLVATHRRDDNNSNESTLYDLTVTIPVGSTSAVALDLGRFQNKSVANADSTAFTVRYDYFLSKRTTLYTGFAKIRNDAGAAFGVNGATGAAVGLTPGQDPRTFVAGIRHTF